jgi:hypothetical protein
MSCTDPRRSTLHRQPRTKILAKTINNREGDTAKPHLTYFGTIKPYKNAERKSSSAATANSEPVCSITGNLTSKIYLRFLHQEKKSAHG